MQPTNARFIRRFQLYHPTGLGGAAFLSAWLSSGQLVSIPLEPRIAAVVHALDDARLEDRTLEPADARGWRSHAQVAKRMERRTDYLVNTSTVTQYLGQLQRDLSAAVRKVTKDETARLVEHRRRLGVRLAEGVEITIIDGAQRGQQGAAAEDETP